MPTPSIVRVLPAALVAIVVVGVSAQAPIARPFDDDRVGVEPAGFSRAAWRQPSPGSWLVQRRDSTQFLAHAADPAASGFDVLVADGDPWRDVVVSVRLRLTGGTRRGGLVWRYRSATDHYQVMLDLVRRELAMYRVVAGNRVRLDDEEDLELDVDAWHTLKVVHDGDEVRVSLGGIRVFEEADRTFGSGRVGLLSGGDAAVSFDDFKATPERKSR